MFSRVDIGIRNTEKLHQNQQQTGTEKKQHKLDAYLHQETYDFSNSFVGRGVDRFGNPRRMRHQLNNSFEEVAILIGNYDSVDDPKAQRDLKKIKSLALNSLEDEDKKKSRSFAELRKVHNQLLKK